MTARAAGTPTRLVRSNPLLAGRRFGRHSGGRSKHEDIERSVLEPRQVGNGRYGCHHNDIGR